MDIPCHFGKARRQGKRKLNSIRTFRIPLEKTNIKKTKKNSKKGSLKIKIGGADTRDGGGWEEKG